MTDRAALRGSVSTSFWTPVFSRSSEKKAQLRAYFTSRNYSPLSWLETVLPSLLFAT